MSTTRNASLLDILRFLCLLRFSNVIIMIVRMKAKGGSSCMPRAVLAKRTMKREEQERKLKTGHCLREARRSILRTSISSPPYYAFNLLRHRGYIAVFLCSRCVLQVSFPARTPTSWRGRTFANSLGVKKAASRPCDGFSGNPRRGLACAYLGIKCR